MRKERENMLNGTNIYKQKGQFCIHGLKMQPKLICKWKRKKTVSFVEINGQIERFYCYRDVELCILSSRKGFSS